MSDFANLVNDFLNIEVNTIIKDGMTAEKMPEWNLAVLQILAGYIDYIGEQEIACPSLPEGIEQAKEGIESLKGDPLNPVIEGIKKAAAEGIPRVPDKHASVLRRIHTNCEGLQRILAKSKFEIKDRLAIRKMWEIGTEQVIIQTCIHLDGDVMTRISPELVDHDPEIRDMLLSVHRESTSVSVQYWKSLLDAIKTIAGGFMDRVWNKNPGGK